MTDQEPGRMDADRLDQVFREGLQRISDSLDAALATMAVTNRVTREVEAQERQRGLKSWPEGTGPAVHPIAPLAGRGNADAPELRDIWRAEVDVLEANQAVTWWDLLLKEILEVAAENPALENQGLDTELTQVAALCVSWLKNRDRRRKAAAGTPEPEQQEGSASNVDNKGLRTLDEIRASRVQCGDLDLVAPMDEGRPAGRPAGS